MFFYEKRIAFGYGMNNPREPLVFIFINSKGIIDQFFYVIDFQ